MKDNEKFVNTSLTIVVNCFQKLLSSWWRTTSNGADPASNRLWIAFKNYYLRDEGQHQIASVLLASSCELLSKIIIFVMKDNWKWCSTLMLMVVNCFQKLLSSWWRTTGFVTTVDRTELWIAFKNYYLRDEGQHFSQRTRKGTCCELLSKIIIFVMKDNFYLWFLHLMWVVNCFQKLLSSWWRTTTIFNNIRIK